MKSKTSFFNKTIFLKNVTLYWPLWGLYTILLLGFQPFSIWLNFHFAARRQGAYTLSEKMEEVIWVLGLKTPMVITACAAVFIGMAVFSYMYNSKSANMIHALPVNKTELFGTNVLSGLSFLILPQILSFVLSVFICLAYGMTRVEYLAVSLLVDMATAFIAFAFVTICAMLTGLLIALPIYAVVVNLLSYWVYFLVWFIVSTFGYGVTNLGYYALCCVDIFSPLWCFYNHVYINAVYENGVCTGMKVHGMEYMVPYFAVALVLYGAAYVTYQKRHVECAGELISVNWLKPIFRWWIGISGGIMGSVLVCQLAKGLGMDFNLLVFILVMLFLGALSYFAADMFVRKSFRVFKKKNWIGCGAFSGALLVTFFLLYGVADMYEKYVPKKADVVDGTFSMGYEIKIDKENAEEILALHEEILANHSYLENYEKRGYYLEGNYEYITITYNLENGDHIDRGYMLPYELEETVAIIQKIEHIERQPEVYLANELCERYDQVTEFGTGWLSAPFINEGFLEEDYGDDTGALSQGVVENSYENRALTPEMAEKLWAAVIADTHAGTLMKYNIYSAWAQDEVIYFEKENASIHLKFRDPDMTYGSSMQLYEDSFGYTGEVYVEQYESWSSVYIYFGSDCENIINVLIECGLIESAEDIYWGEEI